MTSCTSSPQSSTPSTAGRTSATTRSSSTTPTSLRHAAEPHELTNAYLLTRLLSAFVPPVPLSHTPIARRHLGPSPPPPDHTSDTLIVSPANDPWQEENIICSEGQHLIRNLDENGNPLKEDSAEHRVRRLSRLTASRRLAASSSSSSSSSGSSGSSGASGNSSGSAGSAGSANEDDSGPDDSGLRRFVEFGHDERKLLWAPDLHVVNEKGEPQIHSELMRMYEDGLPLTLPLTLTLILTLNCTLIRYEDGWVEIIELQEGVAS